MTKIQLLIAQVYSAFNRRDVDCALSLMSESVSWPKASEGGRVVGKEEIRAYWGRQWEEFDPKVEPLEVIELETPKTEGLSEAERISKAGAGKAEGVSKAEVRVHQVVKSLSGEVLSDSEVLHAYTIANGLIERMDIGGSEAGPEQAMSAAFARS